MQYLLGLKIFLINILPNINSVCRRQVFSLECSVKIKSKYTNTQNKQTKKIAL